MYIKQNPSRSENCFFYPGQKHIHVKKKKIINHPTDTIKKYGSSHDSKIKKNHLTTSPRCDTHYSICALHHSLRDRIF